MAKQEGLSLISFKNKFATEEACREHLYNMRWPDGFRCPKCGCEKHYKISTRGLNECSSCHYQSSVTVGTVMDKTHLKLQIWFWAIYLTGHDKRGVSAMMLQRELEISYKSAWFMLHRIRKAMTQRDSNYSLAGIVELDDSYFGAPTKNGKRGRGTDKMKVVVALSVDKKGCPEYLKMEIVQDLKKETFSDFAKKNIQNGSKISSDAFSSMKQLTHEGYDLEQKVFIPQNDTNHLKWLHTMIGNAKAFILGTYHGLDDRHFQKYLDEFCFRFNRRQSGNELFNRIVNSCVNCSKLLYTELTT